MTTTRRKTVNLHPYPKTWTVSFIFQANGRWLTPGTEVKIRGERGRFRFVKHVVSSQAEWCDFVGGANGHDQFRSFRPERIRTVHRIPKTRASAKAVAA